MEKEITKEYNSDFHLDTIKTTIDYLHNSRNKHNSEKHDELIHDLIKLVTLVKGFDLDYFKEKTEPTPIEELIEKHTGMKYEDYLRDKRMKKLIEIQNYLEMRESGMYHDKEYLILKAKELYLKQYPDDDLFLKNSSSSVTKSSSNESLDF
tara:strand:- start:2223 stop:2675 length:453 start_codon:yes stop_codon:yes gene_type:complete